MYDGELERLCVRGRDERDIGNGTRLVWIQYQAGSAEVEGWNSRSGEGIDDPERQREQQQLFQGVQFDGMGKQPEFEPDAVCDAELECEHAQWDQQQRGVLFPERVQREVSGCIQCGYGKQHESHPIWSNVECESKVQIGERFFWVLPNFGAAYVVEASSAAEHLESGGAVGRLQQRTCAVADQGRRKWAVQLHQQGQRGDLCLRHVQHGQRFLRRSDQGRVVYQCD